jgi:hypothetical protein
MREGYTGATSRTALYGHAKGKTDKMKKPIRSMMTIFALAGPLLLSAQTAPPGPTTTTQNAPAIQALPTSPSADEVVAKYVAAIGGKDAINQVKSISLETSVQVMGNDAPSTTVIVDGVGYKTETEFNGSKIVQCFTDKGGWVVNPMSGAADPTPMADDEYNEGKGQIHVGGELYDYAAKGSKVELLGKDPGVFKIKLTTKDKVETTYVIDAKTYLLKSLSRKGKMQGQDVDVDTDFSDYRKTDVGYLMPYAMAVDFGGQFSLNVTVKKVELNKAIPAGTFDMPKAPAASSAAAPAA